MIKNKEGTVPNKIRKHASLGLKEKAVVFVL